MRIVLGLVVWAGCTADAEVSPEPADTLGAGTVTKATWNGGDCPRDWSCAGTITFSIDHVTARFADGSLLADGVLTSAAYTQMRNLVAQISVDEPTGFLPEGTDGPGISEVWIANGDELRVYVSNGFSGAIGLYIDELRASIETCSTTMATFTTCTP